MNRYKFAVSFFVVWVAAPGAVLAQNIDLAGALYGQGVDAFISGRSADADASLSRAIAANPDDPRMYYFRSLSRLRQGRHSEARADMQAGADVEARQPTRFDIGRSLERIQGPARLLLEQYRDKARLSTALQVKSRPTVSPDVGVLRERRVVPLDELMKPGTPRSIAAPEPPPADGVAPSANAFTPPAKAAAPSENATPLAPASKAAENENMAPAAEANPFGDETTPTAPSQARPQVPPQTPPAKAPAAAAPKTPPQTPPKTPAEAENPFL
jgi:hypothetical protein